MRTVLLALFLIASSTCFADLKFRMQTTAAHGRNRDSTVYFQGQRIRTELPDTGRVNIRQCDLNRVIRLDPSSKTYAIVPIRSKPEVPQPQPVSTSGPQACRVKMRREVEEVSGVEQLFGMPAQHLRMWIYMDPVPESCPNGPRMISHLTAQRDGWYLEVPIPECPARSEEDLLGMMSFDGPDRYVRSDGSISSELLPANVEVNVPKGQGLQTEFTAAISEVSTEPLDAALFDVPPDYHPAADYRPAAGRDCSNGDVPFLHLDDGTPVYQVGCGIIPPRIVYQTEPEFSEHARKKKIQGTVYLALFVGTDGSVRDVKVERSLEKSLDQQAIAAAKLWKFEPALKDEQPVAVQVKIEMSFRLY
jgi:TonB family protein